MAQSNGDETETLSLRKFVENDISLLTPLMRAAFDEDSRIHLKGPVGGPPGYDNGDFLRKWFLHPTATPYVVMEGERAIGGVNLWIHPDGNNFLGCIFLDPIYENRGYGLRVWQMVELLYPDTVTWRTETPIFSHRNHNFYINKCHFKCVRISNPKDVFEGSFLLEKTMK